MSAVVWITGIPAAGKTTLAHALHEALVARGRPAHVLDGDDLRATVSRDLGFGDAARAEQARRATALALEHAAQGEVAIVSLVSPFAADRAAARAAVEQRAVRFVEVHLDTPLAECQTRDPKGLYARAAAGEISQLTGFDAPYEAPAHPEVHLGGEHAPALDDCVSAVLAALPSPAGRASARDPGA